MEKVLDLERRGWDSLCDGTGAKFYGDLMTEDAVMVVANGVTMDRAAVIASLEEAPPWHSYEIDDVRLIDAGEDAAALVYVGTGYREGDQPAFIGVMASVYVLQGDRFRLALYQQTPLPSADA